MKDEKDKTQEQIEAELKVLQKQRQSTPAAATAVGESPATVTPPPEKKPEVAEPPPVVAPDQAKLIADLTAKQTASEAKITELMGLIRQRDGQEGGVIRDLRDSVRELTERNTAMLTELATLKDAAKTPPPVSIDAASFVSDDERVNDPEKAAKKERLVQTLIERTAKAEQQAAEAREAAVQAQQATVSQADREFVSAIYAAIPDYDAIKSDPEALKMANAPDEFGETLIARMQHGERNRDPRPFIVWAKRFKNSKSKPEPTAEEKTKQEADDADRKARLAASGAPGAAGGSTTQKRVTAQDEATKRVARMEAYRNRALAHDPTLTDADAAQQKKDREVQIEYEIQSKRGKAA